MSNQEEKDPWSEALTEKVDELEVPILKELEAWKQASKPSELRSAVDNFSTENVITKIEEFCEGISQWYIQEHDKLIRQFCKEVEIKPDPWLSHLSNGWLYGEVISEIKALEGALNQVKYYMGKIADYIEKNRGLWANVKQFVDGFIKGTISPFREGYEYIKDLLNGFDDPEAQKIEEAFRHALDGLAEESIRLRQVVYAKCVARWSDNVLGALKDIENSLLPNKAIPAPSIFKRCFWGVVKIAFFAALALGGMVLLKKYGVF